MIKYYAITHRVTGVIESIQLAGGGDHPPEGVIPGSQQLKERHYIPVVGWEGKNETLIYNEYYRKDGAWVHRGPPPNAYYEWSTDTETWVFNQTQFLKDVRRERDRRLFISDWTQFSDCPLEVSVRENWKAYRQLLRDLPATVDSSITSLDLLSWPDTPTGEPVIIST